MILRGQDNKVLRGVSGEVFEQSDAIIDLRSTFGVTKNASNEVSRVKLYNNPSQVFRAPIGNEPIENGDGFEFSDNILQGKNIDLSGDWSLQYRFKPSGIGTYDQYISNRTKPATDGIVVQRANAGISLLVVQGGATSAYAIRPNINLLYGVKSVFIIEKKANQIKLYITELDGTTNAIIYVRVVDLQSTIIASENRFIFIGGDAFLPVINATVYEVKLKQGNYLFDKPFNLLDKVLDNDYTFY